MKYRLKIEEWLFIIYIATLSFANLLQFRILNVSIQLSDLLFLIAMAGWFYAVVFKFRKIRWSWFYFFLAFYAVAIVLSTITSTNPTQSAVKLVGKFYLISIAFLTFNLVSSFNFLKVMLRAWLIGAGITLFFSLAGIALFYAGLKNPAQNFVVHPIYGSLPPGYYPRIEGFFNYPSMLCNFLNVSWMFAILLKLLGWVKNYKFWVFCAALWIVGIFTLTPGIGGLFLSTGYFLRQKFKENQKLFSGRLVFAASFLIAFVFLFFASVTIFSYTQNGSEIPIMSGEFSPSHRAESWRTAFETFLQNPVFGRGVGEPVAEARYTDPSGTNQLLTDAHNTYISVLGETGLLGFLAFFGIIGFITFSVLRQSSENKVCNSIKFCFLAALLGAFFYQSLTGSYEDTRHLWVLFGLASAMSNCELICDRKND